MINPQFFLVSNAISLLFKIDQQLLTTSTATSDKYLSTEHFCTINKRTLVVLWIKVNVSCLICTVVALSVLKHATVDTRQAKWNKKSLHYKMDELFQEADCKIKKLPSYRGHSPQSRRKIFSARQNVIAYIIVRFMAICIVYIFHKTLQMCNKTSFNLPAV